MGAKPLQEDSEFSVIATNGFTHANHCDGAGIKASSLPEFMARNFECRIPEVLLSLYNSMVLY